MLKSPTDLKYEIVRTYMNKEINRAIIMCGNYINSKKDELILSKQLNKPADHEMDGFILQMFRLLFDMFQVKNDKRSFINLIKTYKELGLSDTIPQWIDKGEDYHETISSIANNNTIFFKGGLYVVDDEDEMRNRIKNFTYYNIKQNKGLKKIARIDLNSLKINESNPKGIEIITHMLFSLRISSSNAVVVIMGDNKVLEYEHNEENVLEILTTRKNHTYKPPTIHELLPESEKKEEIKPENETKSEEISDRDYLVLFMKNIYLLQLELIQWQVSKIQDKKDNQFFKLCEKKYLDVSMNYYKLINEFPPEMSIVYKNDERLSNVGDETFASKKIDGEVVVITYMVKDINQHNIYYLIDNMMMHPEKEFQLDLKYVDYFSYDAVVMLAKLLVTGQYRLSLHNTNEMIKVIFEMVDDNITRQ